MVTVGAGDTFLCTNNTHTTIAGHDIIISLESFGAQDTSVRHELVVVLIKGGLFLVSFFFLRFFVEVVPTVEGAHGFYFGTFATLNQSTGLAYPNIGIQGWLSLAYAANLTSKGGSLF
jgi:hypothetical protein